MPPTDNTAGSLPARYFDELYGRAPDGDPWRFAASPYEAAKYAATLDDVPRPRYGSALEVGCSIGVFTRLLADRVDHLLAVDIAPAAVDRARDRCRDRPHVDFACSNLLDAVPRGPFDLITLAEVGYYWAPADFDRTFARLAGELAPGGQMILVHWRPAVPDYPMTGDEVHDRAAGQADGLGLVHRGGRVEVEYRVDLWERAGGRSG